MEKYIIGIDGGASYSRGVLFDCQGETVSSHVSEGMNLSVYGSIAASRIKDMISELLSISNLGPENILSIGLGLAASSNKDGRDLVFKELDTIGLSDNAIIINDAEAAFCVGCPTNSGILVTVGTGVICIGTNNSTDRYRSAGKGHYEGDIGSGFWIGQQAIMKLGLNEAIVASDNDLSEIMSIVLTKYNNTNFSNAIEEIMSSNESVKLIASIAKEVIEVAEKGNSVALSIVQEGTISVSEYVLDVLDQMGSNKKSIILAGNGSVIRNDYYRKNLNDALMFDLPDLAWTFSSVSAAYGAGMLSAKSKGVEIKLNDILNGNPMYATNR